MSETSPHAAAQQSLDHVLRETARTGLAKVLSDAEYANALADYVEEIAGVKPAYTKLVVTLIAPLVRKGVEVAGGWMSARAAEAVKQRVVQLPGVQRVLDEIARGIAKVSVEAAARQQFDKMLAARRAGGGPGFDGDNDLSRELRTHLETLATLDDLGITLAEVRAACDVVLAQLAPQPVLQLTQLPRASNVARLVFRARRAALAGRESELASLDAFLDDDATFTWWALTGKGGLGKSRLALEFGVRVGAAVRVGFLNPTASFDWDRWQPDRPTLIITDYVEAEANRGAVFHLLRRLAHRRDLLFPVRVLLLARTAASQFDPKNWYAQLTTASSDAHVVAEAQHAPPEPLGGLNDHALWSVIEAFLPAGSPPLDRDTVLADLRVIDPARRPLFAALAGDALGSHRTIRDWSQDRLVLDVIERERARFWRRSESTDSELDLHENLLAVATLAGGMMTVNLPTVVAASEGMLPEARAFNPTRYADMVGSPATSRLAPWEPDIVGELFVLRQLAPQHDADDRGVHLMRAAMVADLGGTADTLARIGQDFPNHKVVSWLTDRPRGVGAQATGEYAAICAAVADGMREGGHRDALRALRTRLEDLARVPMPDGRPHDPILSEAFWEVSCALAWAAGAAKDIAEALEVFRRVEEDSRANPTHRKLARMVGALAADLSVDLANCKHAQGGVALVAAARRIAQAFPEEALFRQCYAMTAYQVISVAGDVWWHTVAQHTYEQLKTFAAGHAADREVQVRLAWSAHNLMADLYHTKHPNNEVPSEDLTRFFRWFADLSELGQRFPDDLDFTGQLGVSAALAAKYYEQLAQPFLAARASALAAEHREAATFALKYRVRRRPDV